MGKTIQTVTGPIQPEQLGVTLTHEHLSLDCKTLYERAHPEIRFSRERICAENRAGGYEGSEYRAVCVRG